MEINFIIPIFALLNKTDRIMNSTFLYIFKGSKNAIVVLDNSVEFENGLTAELGLTCQAFSLAEEIIRKAGLKSEDYELMLETEVLEAKTESEMELAIDNAISSFEHNNNFNEGETFTTFTREFTDEDMKDYYGENDISQALLAKDIDDAEDILARFGKVKFVDEKIDDGDDGDGEDEYVMMRSYNVGKKYVRIYYGNNTGKIGCVDVK